MPPGSSCRGPPLRWPAESAPCGWHEACAAAGRMTANPYDAATGRGSRDAPCQRERPHRRPSPARSRRRYWLFALVLLLVPAAATAQVRIKDITDVQGVRDNQLVGYGLVVGLNNTGDKLDNNIFTRESLIGMLERLGVNTQDNAAKLETKNVAAVMVTADLPAFAREGSRIDVSASALGDATDLTGGTLLVTPLLAADGQVYAVAQGALATGAIAARGAATSVTRGVPTAGHIANGATVEREVPFRLGEKHDISLALRNADFTTAGRIVAAIDAAVGPIAHATDPRTVMLDLNGHDPIATLTTIEDLRVVPDTPAVVVIDEASGTVVMGANVRISTVAIAQGNLTVRVTETPEVSQPGPLSNGKTKVVPRTQVQIDDQHDRKLGIVRGSVTLRDLVASLNALGVGPRDLISILQAIKAAGALQADLVVR
ncbi:MAG TPA: flagellar basal body P-ring protein FlgI [Acetobacteraceae bacterium]|nr:flagellar basal body P-ring protein FlgI [Acetobacteraceae bacterium]